MNINKKFVMLVSIVAITILLAGPMASAAINVQGNTLKVLPGNSRIKVGFYQMPQSPRLTYAGQYLGMTLQDHDLNLEGISPSLPLALTSTDSPSERHVIVPVRFNIIQSDINSQGYASGVISVSLSSILDPNSLPIAMGRVRFLWTNPQGGLLNFNLQTPGFLSIGFYVTAPGEYTAYVLITCADHASWALRILLGDIPSQLSVSLTFSGQFNDFQNNGKQLGIQEPDKTAYVKLEYE